MRFHLNRMIRSSIDEERIRGFTLVEITVTVAIIALLATMVLLSNREGERALALQRASHRVAQDIRRAQDMAISGRDCPECSGDEVFGYGIFFDIANPTSYFIYADVHPPAPNGNDFYDASQDVVIENISMEEGAVLHSLNGGAPRLCINFRPPDPTVKIKEDETDDLATGQIDIIFGSDTSDVRTITVNKAGLIDID
jgi:prepilin-type N-terminal cleavage/methylation domain-containing protein